MAMHGIPAYNELERFSDQPGIDEALFLKTGSEDQKTARTIKKPLLGKWSTGPHF